MTKLKIYDDGKFDMEIKSATKVGDCIKVEVETPFGVKKVTISRQKDYLDITGIPKWKKEALELVSSIYKRNFKNTEKLEVDLLEKDKDVKFKSN